MKWTQFDPENKDTYPNKGESIQFRDPRKNSPSMPYLNGIVVVEDGEFFVEWNGYNIKLTKNIKWR